MQSNQALQQWCIRNVSFSPKVEEGYWGPFGDFLNVPTNISRYCRDYRYSGGWNVGIRAGQKLTRIRVLDKDYGHDYHRSLEAAIALLQRRTHIEVLKAPARMITQERFNKNVKFDIPGICLVCSAGGENYDVYRFNITAGKDFRESLYVGTSNTWKAHYDQKLEEAIHRHRRLAERHLSVQKF